jgi:hypothetical protein
METLIGVGLILLACIGLFFMLWAAVAAVLYPWIDRMQAKRERPETVPFDDMLRSDDED